MPSTVDAVSRGHAGLAVQQDGPPDDGGVKSTSVSISVSIDGEQREGITRQFGSRAHHSEADNHQSAIPVS